MLSLSKMLNVLHLRLTQPLTTGAQFESVRKVRGGHEEGRGGVSDQRHPGFTLGGGVKKGKMTVTDFTDAPLAIFAASKELHRFAVSLEIAKSGL